MKTLFDISSDRAKVLLSSGAPVYLPVNPVEFHGPHLSLHNDGIVSQGLIQELHQALARRHPEWPLILAPELELGVEVVPGPGSRSLPFGQARKAVVSACHALADMGAMRVVLMTFHGSPLHNLCLEAGVRELQSRGVSAVAPFHLLLAAMARGEAAAMPELYEPVPDAEDRRRLLAGADQDLHAGFLESSLTLHFAPESVSPDLAQVPPCPEIRPEPRLATAARAAALAGRHELSHQLTFGAVAAGWYAVSPFPGYTSMPHLANARTGAILAQQITHRGVDVVDSVLAGEAPPPRPFMPWVEHVTLGGRLVSIPQVK